MLWTLDLFWSTVSVRWEFVDETLGKPKKTHAVGNAEMEISNTTKKTTPSLTPLIRPKPRSSKQTHAGGASDWLEGRCAFGCDVGLPTLWIEKTWFTPHWAATGTKLSKTIGCWRIVRFWGAVLRFHPKRVALSSTFRYSPLMNKN